MYKRIFQFITIIFISFLPFICKAQSTTNDIPIYGTQYFHPVNLDDSPFYNQDWNNGSVTLFNNKKAEKLQMKYDIVNNNPVYYNPTFKQLFYIDSETIIDFTMTDNNNQKLYFIKYSGENIGFKLTKNDWVRLAVDGNIKLLIRYTSEISKATEINTKAKIVKNNRYFIQTNNNISEIKLRLRSIIKLYPENKKEIKKLASKMYFHNKSETSMIQLLNALNEKDIN